MITAARPRHRHHQARDALPPVGRDGLAGRGDPGLPHRGAREPGADAARLGPDRHRTRRDRRTRACSSRASRCRPRTSSECSRSSSCCVPWRRSWSRRSSSTSPRQSAAASTHGTGIALWIGFGLAVGGAVIGVASTRSAARGRRRPTSHCFLAGENPAWYSPPATGQAPSRQDRYRKSRPPKAPTDMTTPRPRNPQPRPRALRLRRLRACPARDRASRPRARSRPRGIGRLRLAAGRRRIRARRMNNTSTPQNATEVKRPPQETAAHGASLAEKAGFRTREPDRQGRTDLERHRRDRRRTQRQPDRARLPPPQRRNRTPTRQRHRRRSHPFSEIRSRRPSANLN